MASSRFGLAVRWLFASLVLTAVLEGVRLGFAAPFAASGFAGRCLFSAALVAAGCRLWPVTAGRGRSHCSRWYWPVLAVGIASGAVCALSGSAWAAWLALAVLYVLLLGVAAACEGAGFVGRWSVRLLAAACAGGFPVAAAQMESRFSEEEFFVALQAGVLAVYWLLLLLAVRLLRRRSGEPAAKSVHPLAPVGVLAVTAVIVALVAGRGYQRSFYPDSAPQFAGVSETEPFLCGEVEPSASTADGRQVFDELLQEVEANPNAGVAEFGMLALARGERRWAERFHEALLAEAGQQRFTEPAQSVKIGQYEAALRVYYYARVREAFPDLFTTADDAAIRAWFADINRRALTVEWVDWMYGLAFSMRPEGPYENQENGAGLLALLQASDLGAPELEAVNADYLARNPRGWLQRFRNSDDAISYQPAWINNALFQMLYNGQTDAANMSRSFEWLLLQSLPDGACLSYDHPLCSPVAKTAYLGAILLRDPRYVWLADRALVAARATGAAVSAQPGVEHPVEVTGRSPTEGSCLLYGDSGLPNQVGPLAPDKIVFRDGWEEDSRYLLLNLRFTGWHRYKASNTITLMYEGGAVAADALTGADFAWLPRGRSLFRDKRIPRENLNGLQVPRTGASAVVYGLTGIGGEWAQDPPYYASIERFETLGPLDLSRTSIEDWRGWRHERTIYFLHDGPVLIVDEADGQGGAALTWHLVSDGTRSANSVAVGSERASRILWPEEAWDDMELRPAASSRPGQPDLDVTYRPGDDGVLSLATAWLSGAWAEGVATVEQLPEAAGGYLFTAESAAGSLALLTNGGDRTIEAGGLVTNGEAVVLLTGDGSTTVCVVGGTEASVPLSAAANVALADGAELVEGTDWEWRDGRLLLHNGSGTSRCVEVR